MFHLITGFHFTVGINPTQPLNLSISCTENAQTLPPQPVTSVNTLSSTPVYTTSSGSTSTDDKDKDHDLQGPAISSGLDSEITHLFRYN